MNKLHLHCVQAMRSKNLTAPHRRLLGTLHNGVILSLYVMSYYFMYEILNFVNDVFCVAPESPYLVLTTVLRRKPIL